MCRFYCVASGQNENNKLHMLTYGKYVVTFGVDAITSGIEIQTKHINLFKHEFVLTIPITVALVLNT